MINDYIKINSETLTEAQIYLIRAVQAGIIIGLVFLYKYMLNSRKKYMTGLKKDEKQAGEEAPKREVARSPKKEAKRD